MGEGGRQKVEGVHGNSWKPIWIYARKKHHGCDIHPKQTIEKHREGQKDIRVTFIDLEKAYDRVPREEIWRCMRERNVPEKYVKLIQDMYRGCQTKVRSAAGESGSFNVDVGLHQGSALSPYLFLILMDVLTEGVRK